MAIQNFEGDARQNAPRQSFLNHESVVFLGVMSKLTSLSGRAFSLMRRRFAVLVALAMWPYLALVVIFMIIGFVVRLLHPVGAPPTDPLQTWRSMTVLAKLGVILSFVAFASFPWGVASGGVSVMVCEDSLGREVSLGNVMARLMRRLPSLFVLSFVVGGAVLFGSAFLVVPGFIIFVVSVFAVDLMLNEDAGVVQALTRSYSLSVTWIGIVIALALALAVAAGVLQVVILVIFATLDLEGTEMVAMIWSFIALVPPALIAVFGTLMSLLYCDVRSQRGEMPNSTVQASGNTTQARIGAGS